MWIFFRFISGIYLKSFFIIFSALVGFFVGVDLLLNFKDLPESANLTLFYIIFLAFSAMTYILPISLIFALAMSFLTMIRSNEFVSLYALGLSRNLVVIFPFLWALLFCVIFVALNFTSFAYANDYKRNLIKNGVLTKQNGEIFLKFNDSFVYINDFQNGQSALKGLKIFTFKDSNLSSYTHADTANFDEKIWNLYDGNFTHLPQNFELGSKGLEFESFENSKALEGFKPELIESVGTSSDSSLDDIIEGMLLLKEQGLSSQSLKIAFYKLVFMPFFAPFLMLIIYYFLPIISRFFNLALVGFCVFVATFLVWGTLFLLLRLSENGVIIGEIAILFPIVLLAFFAGFMFMKNR